MRHLFFVPGKSHWRASEEFEAWKKARNKKILPSGDIREQWLSLSSATPDDPRYRLPAVCENAVDDAPVYKIAGTSVSGVYLIEWAGSDNRYIGESNCIISRVGAHFGQLVLGEHMNSRMQEAYIRHGDTGLQFRILERCDPSLLKLREALWIQCLKPNLNIGEGGCHL